MQNKILNQTRNKRGLVFFFGLYARWLASAFSLRFAQGECGTARLSCLVPLASLRENQTLERTPPAGGRSVPH